MDTGVPVMKGPGLYEFLIEAELQHYYNSVKSDLKVQSAAQLKYVTDEDLTQLGMSKPEQRRLKKFYNKHFPQNYLSKFKRLLSVKRDDGLHGTGNINMGLYGAPDDRNGGERSQGPRVPSKHIISSDSITVNKELGMGEFGVVQQGVWTNDGERIQVAIKCLARERMQNNPIEFLKEAAIMHSIDHAHIVRLYGVVLDTDNLMLVTELAPLRSLLECLKEPALRSSFPVLTLCDFAMQMCDGMQYLEGKRLIHRDLAARNILVFSKNKVKISDFGLSRALGQGKDYYQTNYNVNLKLPIAWCAPECISYLRFTTASDVWAYGVTLWEMFSYGFQPWAALTGQQILGAIDEPNYQRLEQPECCPTDHYAVMLDCWKHEPAKRPHFSDLATRLADVRPEQVQAKVTNTDAPHLLPHRVGDVITVLDKSTHDLLWKGVLQNGKTGLFNPAHMITYLGSNLPSGSNRPESFIRNDMKTSSKRKLRTEMISSPQGDLKHTGHVGLDGAYFGDLSFLGGSKVDYNTVPRQIVPPYKPQDDLEQAPLLCGSATNLPAEHVSLPLHSSDHINISHVPPPANHPVEQRRPSNKVRWQGEPIPPQLVTDHEYHEISDEENLVAESPRFEMDFGPSLMDEMESVFRNLNSPLPGTPTSSADHEGANKCNELRELTSRLSVSSKHRKQATVKPISAADSKSLDSAIALANEISARSMNDLDTEPAPVTPVSPNKRKFSFRFPNTGHHDHDSKNERRNFSDEAQSISDLQSTLTEEAQLAYESLIDAPIADIPTQPQFTHQRHRSSQPSLPENPLRMLRSGNLPMIKPRIRTNPTAMPDSRQIHPVLKPKLHGKEENVIADRNSADFDSKSDFQNGFHKRTLSNSTNSIPTNSEDVPDFSHSHDSISETIREKNNTQETNSSQDDNPIPLPPRDRNKPMLTSKARHTRKHPLIIPATSIQRTLDKVKVVTPEDQCADPLELQLNNNIKISDGKTEPFYINQRLVDSSSSIETPERDFDTESLHFEAQIDSDLAALDEIPNEDLDTQITLPTNIRNSVDESILNVAKPVRRVFGQINQNVERRSRVHDNIRNSESKEMCSSDSNGETQQGKFSQSSSVDSMLHHNVDHVSCEDLLEFADTKPSSRARGNESDEVRIMSKVLGAEISKEQCLLALEYSNWDVHKAIKLARLQKLVRSTPGGPFVDLATCNGALETSQWDLGRAASWIVAAHQEGDITQV